MDFKKKVHEYLGRYKQDVLRIKEKGSYKNNTYDHILPISEGDDVYAVDSIHQYNLLPVYRDELWQYILQQSSKKEKFLHQYSHHLNSSQMMCINFFYPFAVKDEIKKHLISAIQNLGSVAFKINNPDDLRFEFEYESAKEKSKGFSPTNFDLYISNNDLNLYFEIKYTETFDAISKKKRKENNEYQKKYDDMYQGFAKKVIKDEWRPYERFYDNYQIMRNLVHIDDNSFVIFLYHDKHTTTDKQVAKAKKFLKKEYQNRLICLTWDDLYSEIKKEMKSVFENDADLDNHFKEFSKKYLVFGE